jgi:membrane protein YqaA with SNARE-associated domain
MYQISDTLQQLIAGMGGFWGGFGLFFVAFFDSSFLSLPEINDVLILYFCTRFKEHAYFYALMAMAGSTAGCSVLYWVGKWKGHGFLVRKYSQTKLASAFRVFQRYGVLAVIGPALMPPPFPFKIFVLSAGIFGLPFPRFLAAVVFGRGFRYFFEAFLAIHYGDAALAYIEANYAQVAVVALAVFVLGLVVYWTVQKSRQQTVEPPVVTPNPD